MPPAAKTLFEKRVLNSQKLLFIMRAVWQDAGKQISALVRILAPRAAGLDSQKLLFKKNLTIFYYVLK